MPDPRPHILVPCKALALGKSRLAPALDAPARERLCRALLSRTLQTLTALGAEIRATIVTADPEAAALARAAGLAALPDPGLGLNAALTAARTRIDTARLVILPIDLPLARPEDLRRLIDAPAEVTIVPDHTGTGTNALALRGAAAARMPLAFGALSRTRHQGIARQHGLTRELLPLPTLALDIDEPENLAAWRATLQSERTKAA